MLISSHDLTALTQSVFLAARSEEAEARAIAENLVTANLMGHDSHGVILVPQYVEEALDGRLTPGASVSVVTDNGVFLLLDGNMGYGQVIGRRAMELGIAKARERGAAILGLRNTHHLGRIGAWGELCAQAGLVSMHYVTAVCHSPLVAPFGGSDARLSTDPICITFPATDGGPPVVLDMATSVVAGGKIKVAYNKGVPLAEGRVIDAEGKPSTDPGVIFPDRKGAMLPVGEHKGSGLALVCEILSGALTGGGASDPATASQQKIKNNMFSVIFDPQGFGADIPFAAELDRFVAYIKQSPPQPGVDAVMVPGEPERRSRAIREKDGIPLDDTTWEELIKAGVSAGMNRTDFTAVGRA